MKAIEKETSEGNPIHLYWAFYFAKIHDIDADDHISWIILHCERQFKHCENRVAHVTDVEKRSNRHPNSKFSSAFCNLSTSQSHSRVKFSGMNPFMMALWCLEPD